MKTRHRVILVGAAAVVVGIEFYGIAHPDQGWTISEFIQWAFHVDTTPGAVIFVAAMLAFTAWFIPHILTWRPKK